MKFPWGRSPLAKLARRVWSDAAKEPSRPPPSRAEIGSAEAHWKVRFPAMYLALLEVRNGGYLRPELEPELLGIGLDDDASIEGRSWADLEEWASDWLPTDRERLVPFAGDGHSWWCFDYRGPDEEPTITCVDLECGSEESIAGSFVEFLERDIVAARAARLERAQRRAPLHDATTRAEVEALVAAGADLNEPNGDGKTPLMCACSEHRDEVVLALLDAGADPTKRSEQLGMCALDLVHHVSVAALERMLASATFSKSDLWLRMANYKLWKDEARMVVLERHTGVGRDDFDAFAGVVRAR